MRAPECVRVTSGLDQLVQQTATVRPLGFLAILPLTWTALRRNQRDTATVALILSGFAVWGGLLGGGPYLMPPD